MVTEYFRIEKMKYDSLTLDCVKLEENTFTVYISVNVEDVKFHHRRTKISNISPESKVFTVCTSYSDAHSAIRVYCIFNDHTASFIAEVNIC